MLGQALYVILVKPKSWGAFMISFLNFNFGKSKFLDAFLFSDFFFSFKKEDQINGLCFFEHGFF